MKVAFTETEYKILAKSAERMMRARTNLSAKDWSKPANKLTKVFANKFSMSTRLAGDDQEVHLDRSLLRLIEEVCEMSKTALETTVIPEYVNRGLNDTKNLEYHTKAVALVADFNTILTKVKALL